VAGLTPTLPMMVPPLVTVIEVPARTANVEADPSTTGACCAAPGVAVKQTAESNTTLTFFIHFLISSRGKVLLLACQVVAAALWASLQICIRHHESVDARGIVMP
jgi:hypothetical protein